MATELGITQFWVLREGTVAGGLDWRGREGTGSGASSCGKYS